MTTASEQAAAILKAGKRSATGGKTASEIAAERLLGFDGRRVSDSDVDDLIERSDWSPDDRKRALAALREARNAS